MDFSNDIRLFSTRVERLKDKLITEEATKTSLIMPFFQLLGYDVFNPDEFLPEFIADVGIKKGEKVDYAIMKDNQPLILIEAKQCSLKELAKCASQLYRYFSVTKAKFTILTNGIVYMFYTDLDEPNKMDAKPFFQFDLLDIKDSAITELKKFRKENLDVETILNTASELKYTSGIKQLMEGLLHNPSDSFINFILSEVYEGRKTQNVVEKFREVIKKSINQYINELMNERIKNAIENQVDKQIEKQPVETKIPISEVIPKNEEEKPKILTTVEELESYFIVKSILRDVVEADKITYKDTLSYFGILLDNNTWKWICRIYIRDNVKYIIIPDANKNELRFDIKSIDDIYKHKEKLIEVINRYKQ